MQAKNENFYAGQGMVITGKTPVKVLSRIELIHKIDLAIKGHDVREMRRLIEVCSTMSNMQTAVKRLMDAL